MRGAPATSLETTPTSPQSASCLAEGRLASSGSASKSPLIRASRLGRPTLYLFLDRERCPDVLELREPHQHDRSSVTRVRRTIVAVVVLPDPELEIVCAADVAGPVGTLDDVGEGHAAWCSAATISARVRCRPVDGWFRGSGLGALTPQPPRVGWEGWFRGSGLGALTPQPPRVGWEGWFRGSGLAALTPRPAMEATGARGRRGRPGGCTGRGRRTGRSTPSPGGRTAATCHRSRRRRRGRGIGRRSRRGSCRCP